MFVSPAAATTRGSSLNEAGFAIQEGAPAGKPLSSTISMPADSSSPSPPSPPHAWIINNSNQQYKASKIKRWLRGVGAARDAWSAVCTCLVGVRLLAVHNMD